MDFDERLYLSDPLTCVFEATVRRCDPGDGGLSRVWLDRTCFYPESGGQPDDRGTLGGLAVRGVSDDEHGVCHLVEGALEAGTAVEGRIDMARRLDHMQQHTGQHLLSAVFAAEAGRATVGFHLGERTSTIDLGGEADEALLARAEPLVNELVQRNLPVTQRVVTRGEYEALPGGMRSRLPGGVERVRIVEISGVDGSTCCGTHCPATGMVGPVKILSTENLRGGTRVEFVCGMRAVRDSSEKHALLRRLGLMFSTDWRNLPAVADSLAAENRSLRKERDGLVREIAALRAGQMAGASGTIGSYRLVRSVFEQADAAEVRGMISKLRAEPDTIVLFAIAAPGPTLLFACTPGLPLDIGSAMRAATAVMGGRGGGGADFAQGGGGDPARIGEALDAAERLLGEAAG